MRGSQGQRQDGDHRPSAAERRHRRDRDIRQLVRAERRVAQEVQNLRRQEQDQELAEKGQPCVIACGDGVLYDDDSRSIICENELVIAGADLSEEELWENASSCRDSYHAFMSFGTEEEKRKAFADLIRRQRLLFEGVVK